MVVLFMIAMVLTFIIVDYVVQRRQTPAPVPSQMPLFSFDDVFLPDGLFSTPGHMWSELKPRGSLRLGPDKFLLNAVGSIDRVETVKPGSSVKTGDVLFKVFQGDKEITCRAPFSGRVRQINRSFQDAFFQDIRDAWAVEFQPENLAGAIKSCRVGHEAKEWLKFQTTKFRDFLNAYSQTSPAFAIQDGGLPQPGVLASLPNTVWKQFETEFLTGAES